MYWIDKVIEEIKSRCADFDVDKAMKHVWSIKSKKNKPPMPPEWEWMMVVEIETTPADEKIGVPEKPLLPSEVSEWEIVLCPECWKDPCECEKPEEKPEDKSEPEMEENQEESAKEEEDNKAQAEWMKAITETKEELGELTPSEEDRMDKILDAIKTFFPNENTEDVLVRIVSKLIDR